jgi:hypothetical protein
MNKIQLTCFLFFILFSCTNAKKKELAGVEKICNNLFLEKFYYHQGGVYGGEILEVYVTDSVAYREYIGRVDEKEYYKISCVFDSIKIYKMSTRQRDKGVISSSYFIKSR